MRSGLPLIQKSPSMIGSKMETVRLTKEQWQTVFTSVRKAQKNTLVSDVIEEYHKYNPILNELFDLAYGLPNKEYKVIAD